jgi:hypothetical protein
MHILGVQASGLPACTPFCNGVQAHMPICSWRAGGGLAYAYQPPFGPAFFGEFVNDKQQGI